jgi:hypothetical protein
LPHKNTHHFVLGDVRLDNGEVPDVVNDLGCVLVDLLRGKFAAVLEDADGADAVAVESHLCWMG